MLDRIELFCCHFCWMQTSCKLPFCCEVFHARQCAPYSPLDGATPFHAGLQNLLVVEVCDLSHKTDSKGHKQLLGRVTRNSAAHILHLPHQTYGKGAITEYNIVYNKTDVYGYLMKPLTASCHIGKNAIGRASRASRIIMASGLLRH